MDEQIIKLIFRMLVLLFAAIITAVGFIVLYKNTNWQATASLFFILWGNNISLIMRRK